VFRHNIHDIYIFIMIMFLALIAVKPLLNESVTVKNPV